MSAEGVIQSLMELSSAYTSLKLSKDNIRVYVEHLSDLPDEALHSAVRSIIRTSNFFPSIAEIRETTLRHTPYASLPSPTDAWANVAEQLQQAGTWHVPSFAHPLIAQAVRTMGWYDLCRSDNQMADRAHFLRIYSDMRDTSWREALCALPAPETRRLHE